MHRILALGAVSLLAAVICADAAAWSWPADGAVLQPFTLGGDAYAAGQHRGIDVAGPDGSDVRAPAAGVVTFAGSLPTYGRGVTILTSDGYAVTLVHLGAIDVATGATVAEGAPIGAIGSSGTPEHSVPSVHLGIRRAADEQGYVDPLRLLPPRGVASDPSAEPTPAPEPTTPPVTVESPVPPAAAPVAQPAPVTATAAPAAATPTQPAGSPASVPPVTATSATTPTTDVETGAPGSDRVSAAAPSTAARGPTPTAVAAASGSTPTGTSPGDAAAPVFEVNPGAAAPAAHHTTSVRTDGPVRSRPTGQVPLPTVAKPTVVTAATAPPSRASRPPAVHPAAARSRPVLPAAHAAVDTTRTAAVSSQARPVSHVQRRAAEPKMLPAGAARRALGGGAVVRASAGPTPTAPRLAEMPAAVVPPASVPVDLHRIGLAAALVLLLAVVGVRRVVRRIGGNGGIALPHPWTTST